MAFMISTNPTFEVGGKVFGGEMVRLNDGSLIIRDDCDEGGPRLIVPRVAHLKRGAPYDTPDPAQEAFARKVADLLNQS